MTGRPTALRYSYRCEHVPDGPADPGPAGRDDPPGPDDPAARRLCPAELRAVTAAERGLAAAGVTAGRPWPVGLTRPDLTAALPWSAHLPERELRGLAEDLLRGLHGAHRTGHPAVFGNELAAWRATAEAWHRPERATAVGGPLRATGTALRHPGPPPGGNPGPVPTRTPAPDPGPGAERPPGGGLVPVADGVRPLWDRLLTGDRPAALAAWTAVDSEPRRLDCRRTPLRGALGTVRVDGRELPHWEYRSPDGAVRLRYAPDPVARVAWVTGLVRSAGPAQAGSGPTADRRRDLLAWGPESPAVVRRAGHPPRPPGGPS